MKPFFSVTQPEIKKPQKRYLGNAPKSSDLKNFYMKPPFPVMQPQIAKPGKRYLRIVPRSSDMKFYSFRRIFYMKPPFPVMQPQIEKPGKKCFLFAYCSKEFIYEVSLNLVKGLWRNGFGQTDGQTDIHTAWRLYSPPEIFSGNIKRRNADDQHFLFFSCFLKYKRQK